MFTEKQLKKYKRTKYTRELERFLNRIVSFLNKNEQIDKAEFSAFTDKIFKPLEGIEKVLLNSPYLNQLETFVEKCANLPQSEKEMDEIKKEILHGANQLQKTKRMQNHAGVKHKGRFYD
jgi:hypothetical protein